MLQSLYFCAMKLWKSALNLYLNSSIHVGIEVCCFVLITGTKFQLYYDYKFLSFVFFGTITGYNFVKYAGLAKLHHISLTKNLKLIQIFSFFCFFAFIFYALQLPLRSVLAISVLGILTLLYALPIFPHKKNLRSFKSLKIFIITLVVTGLTVVVPMAQHNVAVTWEVWLVFIQRIFFIIAVILPFEIRDVNFDASELGTIPQQVGLKTSKILGLIFLLLFFLIELWNPASTEALQISSGIIALISAGFILGATSHQSKYYASFWVEGIPIMWFGILLLVGQFF